MDGAPHISNIGWRGPKAVVAIYTVALLAVVQTRQLGITVCVGYDDPWELLKIGFLIRHPDLAERIWNDQPWLHTLLNAALCRWWGEGPLLPRLFNIFSVGAMWMALAWLGRGTIGGIGMAAAILLMAGTDIGLRLMLSTMLEPPAFAWAIVAAALLRTPEGGRPRPWQLLLSGLVMAAALHLKLTAALVAPGLVFLWMRLYGWHHSLRLAPVWLAGFGLGFFLLARLSPSFRWDWLLGSHWTARTGVNADFVSPSPQQVLLQMDHWPCWLAGVAGLILMIRQRPPPVATFAAGSLLGALAFLGVARPWWYYYAYHFFIPAAVLGGWALESAWRRLYDLPPKLPPRPCHPRGKPLSRPWLAVLFLATTAALWTGFALPRTARTLSELGPHLQPGQPWLVDLLRSRAAITRWVYASPHYLNELVQAGVYPPPELLVLSGKRFWSGQITWAQLPDILDQTGTDLLVVHRRRELARPDFRQWMIDHYVLLERFEDTEVWERKLPPEQTGLPP